MNILTLLKATIKKLDNFSFVKIDFNDLKKMDAIYLYAGDIPQNGLYQKFVGLSLSQSNFQHIRHDVTEMIPLEDSCVDIFQSEDVFEHIEIKILPTIINEIYRILKPGGVFRLSLPDYRCDVLADRTQKSERGELLFDPGGGGRIVAGEVIDGGHVWFPKYEIVKNILRESQFREISFYHYYDEFGEAFTRKIDYSIGFIMRTPDHDERVQNPYRPMSIVVDCIK